MIVFARGRVDDGILFYLKYFFFFFFYCREYDSERISQALILGDFLIKFYQINKIFRKLIKRQLW